MRELKAKKDFRLNGKNYSTNEIVKTTDINEIIKLNEKGFIYPLTRKDIQELKIKINSNNVKKEDETDGKDL